MKKRWLSTWSELHGLAPLAAIALLILNDHWAKATFHNALTGKLSDMAICFLLPLLLATGWGAIVGGRLRPRLIGAGIATAILFSLLELSDLAGSIYVAAMAGLGRNAVLTRDVSDLGALGMIPVAVLYGLWKARRNQRPVTTSSPPAAGHRLGWTGLLSAALGTLALMADQPEPVCDHLSLPVVFRADPGCGEGGLFVVEADEDRGYVDVTNRPALGLPPEDTYTYDNRYLADTCPFQLAEGDWQIRANPCSTASATKNPALCTTFPRVCVAKKEGIELWFSCREAVANANSSSNTPNPNPELCRSRLTVVP